VIGYQCNFSGPGEHHVFSHLVKLDIIEEEGVVTSLARDTMPVHNYRTGDRMEWIGPCKCGSSDKRFKLLGRIDNVIQIWSCRMLTNDVEASFQKFGLLTFQIKISESREANVVREKLTLSYEQTASELDQELFLLDLYERSRDVRDTITFIDFKKDLILEALSQGHLPRNPRTGKISTVLDLRN
jgi:phenylacetate-coenzyme A ligase PaaK-like adenylate-forming protein